MSTNSESLAKSTAEYLLERMEEYRELLESDDDEKTDELREEIEQSQYGIMVRSDWETPGEKMKASEYVIILAGGGPAVRIIGDLDEYGQPDNARLEHQDWFERWTEYRGLTSEQDDAILEFASLFYFGEG